MRYLGLDLGSKTLGISISDQTCLIATILKTIVFPEDDYEYLIEPLKKIVNEESIDCLILGYPLNMDGSISKRAEITLEFKKILEGRLHIKVELQDERLTSVVSNQVLIQANISRKKRKKKVDGIAAQLILQSYLDRINKLKEGV